MNRWIAAATLALVASPLSAEVAITVADTYPLFGEPVTVTVADDGVPVGSATVSAEYRPNSRTMVAEAIGTTDASGNVEWTPSDAGLVRLTAIAAGSEEAIASKAVSVRYVSFPIEGILTMLIAGIILFGGAGLGMSILMREEKIPEEEPPST
ncbi:MAG: hypothetical protein KY459_11270 [Acidobacteria bacterium]|nr:hypothetical protein [Acidobacteriota bacterium]